MVSSMRSSDMPNCFIRSLMPSSSSGEAFLIRCAIKGGISPLPACPHAALLGPHRRPPPSRICCIRCSISSSESPRSFIRWRIASMASGGGPDDSSAAAGAAVASSPMHRHRGAVGEAVLANDDQQFALGEPLQDLHRVLVAQAEAEPRGARQCRLI